MLSNGTVLPVVHADGQCLTTGLQVCKHWTRRGFCLFKETCYFRHPPDALPTEMPEPPM